LNEDSGESLRFFGLVRFRICLDNRHSMSAALPESPTRAPSRWFGLVKLAVRLTVIALVVWGIWYTVEKALASLRQEDYSLRELARLDVGWLAASAFFYLAAMIPSCLFWRRVLHAMGQDPPLANLVRAYFIGHLGKYVPGKAMVVVLRTGMVRGPKVDTTVAVVSVFVETLTLMAVGSCFAMALVAARFREHPALLILGAAVTLGAGVPMLPPVFRRLVMFLQMKRLNPQIEHAVAGLDWRVTLWGWGLMLIAWCLMTLSLWAVVKSIPGETNVTLTLRVRSAEEPGIVGSGLPAPQSARHAEREGYNALAVELPVVGAAVALAMVAGFVSFIPGGLGVREVVVIPLLAPLYGNVVALVSAIVLRLVWLLAELAISGVVYFLPTSGEDGPAANRSLAASEASPR
jgi:uncharacterized membrane protein YbhN (UPF0104 family)